MQTHAPHEGSRSKIVDFDRLPQNPPDMLELKFVNAAYDKSQVLWDINLIVHEGEAVALLGRNGVGKTTLLRTITGVHPISSGRIRFGETDLFSILPAFERARRGLAGVPQGFHPVASLES